MTVLQVPVQPLEEPRKHNIVRTREDWMHLYANEEFDHAQ